MFLYKPNTKYRLHYKLDETLHLSVSQWTNQVVLHDKGIKRVYVPIALKIGRVFRTVVLNRRVVGIEGSFI